MGRRLLTGLLVGAIALTCAASASAADSVYWTNVGKFNLSRANLSGGGANLAPSPLKPGTPLSSVVDAARGKIYWGDETTDSIDVANLDGSGSAILPTNGATVVDPEGLSIDPSTGRIYWANFGTNSISWAALDGSGGGNIKVGTATVEQPESVAVSTALGRVYWANSGISNRISWANLSNDNEGGDLPIPEEFTVGVDGVAIDPVHGRLYWTSYGVPLIGSSTLTGMGAAKLPITASLFEGPRGLALDLGAGRVYWVNENNDTVASAALDGSAGALLDTSGASVNGPRDPSLLKAPHAEGAPLLTATGTGLGSPLSCKAPAWAADPVGSRLSWAPQSTTLAWTLNGAPLAGTAGAVSITATQPGVYACQASATNGAGTTTVAGASVTIASLAPAPTKVRLTKVKLDRKHGTATILANVSGPGTLTLTGKKVVRRSVKASGAGIAKVKVAAKGGALKTLIRSHKVKVRFGLSFVAAEGGRASAAKAIVLHRSSHVARPR
jgi:DNA-binding beta-propeller fold protein YncE